MTFPTSTCILRARLKASNTTLKVRAVYLVLIICEEPPATHPEPQIQELELVLVDEETRDNRGEEGPNVRRPYTMFGAFDGRSFAATAPTILDRTMEAAHM
jgi:hypothetical protein